jgi:L-lactate dehydrogenase complex protein LldG
MASTVDRVATLSEVPAAVVRYVDGLKLVRHAVAWTSLGSLPWAEQGMTVECRPPLRDPQGDHDHGDLVGITGCFVAIAETG